MNAIMSMIHSIESMVVLVRAMLLMVAIVVKFVVVVLNECSIGCRERGERECDGREL